MRPDNVRSITITDSLRHSVDAYRRLTTGSLSSIGADSVFAPAATAPAAAEQPSFSSAGKPKKSPDSAPDAVAASAAD